MQDILCDFDLFLFSRACMKCFKNNNGELQFAFHIFVEQTKQSNFKTRKRSSAKTFYEYFYEY